MSRPLLDGLPPMDVAGRLARLRAELAGAHCAGLLVTHLTNVRYLTGFTGSAALLLVTDDGATLVTDGRYTEQATGEVAAAGVDVTVRVGHTRAEQRALVADGRGTGPLGLEADHVTWAAQRSFASEWFADAELVATSGLVERLRVVKDDGEVARIELACRIADDALLDVAPTPRRWAHRAGVCGDARQPHADPRC